jgi:phosphatidylglycerophosphatase A
MKSLARMAATIFGAGRFPFAPGTFASLLAVLAFKFLLSGLPWPFQIGAVILLFFIGVWASGIHSAELGRKDPRPVVVDEVCGQWISLLFAPTTWGFLAGGFVLFRVFDVVKPFPIRRLEALPSGWGIMADDVLAGIYAAAVLQIVLVLR